MALKKNRSEDIIQEHPLVAIGILKKIYADLKKKNPAILTESEINWMDEIEAVCQQDEKIIDENQSRLLLDYAYEILNGKKVWTVRDEAFCEILEKILFLKSREETFKSFFDSIESANYSALQLDFSKRARTFDVVKNDKNIFNYFTVSLNVLLDKLERSVISVKAVNNLFAVIPDTMMIITDGKGKICFINEFGENVLNTRKRELIGWPIQNLFNNCPEIGSYLKDKKQIENMKVSLVTRDKDSALIPASLTILKVCEKQAEIDEIVYLVKVGEKHTPDKTFELTKLSHDFLSPINSMTGLINLLKKNHVESLEYVDMIARNKDRMAGIALKTLDDLKAAQIPVQNKVIDFHLHVKEVMDTLHYMDGFNEIDFKLDIVNTIPFYSNPEVIRSIIQNLISNAVKYRKQDAVDSQVRISVQDVDLAIELKIEDNGIGIKEEHLGKIFEKEFRVSESIEGNGFGLYILKKHVERLNGIVEISSNLGTGTSFTITFPNGR